MTDIPWQPTATMATLRQRAAIIANIRCFFAERDVLEVETPLLARYSVTDPHMDVITADNPTDNGERFYLQTSPEYAMKRLLAAGSGPIFQIGKAFRRGERSRRHNPEFTLLEWYRPGFLMFDLMAEIDHLLERVVKHREAAKRISYRQLFLDLLGIDPLRSDSKTLEKLAREHIDVQMQSDAADDWLNLLMSAVIEPKLKDMGAVFVYHYPATQGALARLEKDNDGVPVAERFELYIDGLELANGYHELSDASIQRERFQQDQQQRQLRAKDHRDSDEYLLAALDHGLPVCSGVALGLDRLIMLALKQSDIAEVLAFPADRA